MTDQSKRLSYENAGYISGKMVNDLSPKKTMLVLVIVVGCFAILWPKVFHPMLVGSANNRIKPSSIDRTQGCCDVIYEKDVTTIKLMSEICNTIIKNPEESPLSNKELIQKCQNIVLDTCGIDISAVLQEQVRLGHTTRQILEEIRSLNGSLCLKYNFGVATWKLGVPHRITVKMLPSFSIKQERPLHLRSEMVHPAFRERGRAIPQPEFAPTKPAPPSHIIKKVVEGRPGPIPGMRPTIGGAGHVVPPSKQSGNSMGLIMPLYTIGIVVFFAYTVMKIVFKKQSDILYQPINPDPHFRKEVFEANRGHLGSKASKEAASSKLGDTEMDQLRNRLRETEMAMERIVEQMAKVPLKFQETYRARQGQYATMQHHMKERERRLSYPKQASVEDIIANGSLSNQEDDQSSVQILGMETTASRENGQKWTRSSSPLLPVAHPHPPDTPPQEIYLEGTLPPQSHLLVTDSATEAQKLDAEEDPAVVLAGKMTLSVISLDSSENGTEESSISGKKPDERSSSNVSEEFEKIDVAQLEEEMNNIIEQAQHINLESSLKEVDSSEGSEACVLQTQDKTAIDAASIENLIEESVGAVEETRQDKQKELDDLLLKTEQDLAKTTEFVDSTIDQIYKDLSHIENEENSQEISARTEDNENVKEELLSAAEEFIKVDETEKEDKIETLNTGSLSSKLDLSEVIEDAKLEQDLKELESKQAEAVVTEIEGQELETEEIAEVESKEENAPQKNKIEEIIDTIKEEIVIEELIIPSARKELNESQQLETTETKTIDEKIPEEKLEVQEDIKIVLDAPNVIEDKEDVVTREETSSQDLLQNYIEKKDEKTDTTIVEKIIESEVDENAAKFEDEYLLESDNDQEEIIASQLTQEVLLDDKNNHEDVVEEEYEEGSEEEYDEEVEIDEENGEEIEQEILEYTSDEEEEIEVEEEEEEDLDEIEDSKVISHV